MARKEYSTFDIVKGLKIPRERLKEWIDRGFISPSIARAAGAGTKSLFSRFDIYLIATFRKLIDEDGLNLSRSKAADMLSAWKKRTSFFAGRLEDGELRDALSCCDVMTVHQSGNKFLLFFEESMLEFMRQDMLKKYPADFVQEELSKFSWIRTDIEKIVKPQRDNVLQDKNWDSVLYINFGKIARIVDEAFPD